MLLQDYEIRSSSNASVTVRLSNLHKEMCGVERRMAELKSVKDMSTHDLEELQSLVKKRQLIDAKKRALMDQMRHSGIR